jgi:hypothetical protein
MALPLLLLFLAQADPGCMDAQGFSGRFVNGQPVMKPGKVTQFPTVLCVQKDAAGHVTFSFAAMIKGKKQSFESPGLTDFSGQPGDITGSSPIGPDGVRWKLRVKADSSTGCVYDPVAGVFACAMVSMTANGQ